MMPLPFPSPRLRRRTILIAVLSLGAGTAAQAQGGSGGSRPSSPAQAPQRIVAGQGVSGSLAAGDARQGDDSYYDLYYFHGSAGQRITVTLRSPDFDAFLHVGRRRGGEAEVLETNDDGGGPGDGTDSRVSMTLPASGEFLIWASSFGAGSTGRYTLLLEAAGAAPGASGGPGAAPSSSTLSPGSTVRGSLAPGDPRIAGEHAYYDLWRYTGRAGERVTLDMASPDFDTYLYLGVPSGDTLRVIARDDDSGEGTSSRIDQVLPASGEYLIRASALTSGHSGAYTLRLDSHGVGSASSPPPPAPSARPSHPAAAPARPAPSGPRTWTASEAYDSIARLRPDNTTRELVRVLQVGPNTPYQRALTPSSRTRGYTIALISDPHQPRPYAEMILRSGSDELGRYRVPMELSTEFAPVVVQAGGAPATYDSSGMLILYISSSSPATVYVVIWEQR